MALGLAERDPVEAPGGRPGEPSGEGRSGGRAPEGLSDQAPPEGLSDEALSAEVRSMAAHLAAGTARFVLLVAEFDRREGWGDWGIRSCAHWLNWRCGMALGAAREHLRVGHALAELPSVRAAFCGGALSYSKVRAISRVATAENEAFLVELAGYTTAHQLEAICRSYRVASGPPETEAALSQRAARTVRSWTNASGQVVLYAELPPEEGAVVLGALDATAEVLFDEEDVEQETAGATASAPAADVPAGTSGPDTSEDAPEPARAVPRCAEGDEAFFRRRADALVALAERGFSQLGEGELAERFLVHVHVDQQVLEDPTAPGCCRLAGFGVFAPQSAERLLCDSVVTTLWAGPDGAELTGRTRRVPPRLRRALRVRDGGCRFPGCTNRRWVDAHHVRWVSQGGKTKLSNLVSLCRGHHHLMHEGGYRLSLSRSGRVRVWRPDGVEVPVCPAPEGAEGPALTARHRAGGLDLDAQTMPYGGERMQLDMILDALLAHGPAAGGRSGPWSASAAPA